jgi:DNA-binding response OmpR family regulator
VIEAFVMTKPKVLFVDDEPDMLEGLARLLRDEGIDVETHTSVITLPLVVGAIDPDVILLDLSMPALSGLALLKMGRARLRTDAPIVLFSGRSAEALAKEAEEAGADGFIAKSEESSDIVSRIQSWIDQRRALRAATAAEANA